MSDEQTASLTVPEESAPIATMPPPGEPLFEQDELQQFDADDVTAGKALCKMLSLFFFYTVIVMAIAGAWTMASIAN